MATPSDGPRSDPVARERRRAWFRVLLGNAQMFFAVVTVVLLLATGMNAVTVVALSLTCGLTLASLLVFRDWDWWRTRR